MPGQGRQNYKAKNQRPEIRGTETGKQPEVIHRLQGLTRY